MSQLSLPRGVKPLRAAVFDMDGVITKTRDTHFLSWKKLFETFLEQTGKEPKTFSQEDYDKFVDGMPRYNGVESFLKSRAISLPHGSPSDKPWEINSTATVCALGNKKDYYFNEVLEESGVQVYDSTVRVIKHLLKKGIFVGVASSSKNCKPVLKRAGIEELFSAIVDGVDIEEKGMKGKPDPDMFLECLSRLGNGKFMAEESMLVEDALMGVQAGRNGGFGFVVGINRGNNRESLLAHGAHVVVDDFEEVSNSDLDRWFVDTAIQASAAIP